MHTLTRASFGALCTIALFVGTSCSSGSAGTSAQTHEQPAVEPSADANTPLPGASGSAGTSAQTHEQPAVEPGADANTPLPGTSAVLVVNGMSCPKCANSIHVSLAEVPGVSDSTVDLGTGLVTVQFDPLNKANPSRATLAKVIKNSGFTLVNINPN